MFERVCGWFQNGPTRILNAVTVSNAALLGGPEWGPRMRVVDGRTPDPLSDLALALAHDARTKQLLAIGRGEPPPSLNSHQARLSPLATLDEEAELLFLDELHNHLIEKKNL
eukprot:scaffold7703_cov103-Isochrysis_galbana.AAC.16